MRQLFFQFPRLLFSRDNQNIFRVDYRLYAVNRFLNDGSVAGDIQQMLTIL